jgi:hypothetical protein
MRTSKQWFAMTAEQSEFQTNDRGERFMLEVAA